MNFITERDLRSNPVAFITDIQHQRVKKYRIWIHFSDLHFNKTNINTRLLRDSIRSFLTENQIECDYAFFSGDLRNAPDHCFQKDSVKYLRELCEGLK